MSADSLARKKLIMTNKIMVHIPWMREKLRKKSSRIKKTSKWVSLWPSNYNDIASSCILFNLGIWKEEKMSPWSL